MIELVNISKTYGNNKNNLCEALKDASFSIDKGEMVAIMGTSGAGKSTLLHIIAGMIPPTHGSYRFQGMELKNQKEKKRAKFRSESVGIVIQDFALLEGTKVKDNMLLPTYFTNMSKKKSICRAKENLKEVGMEDSWDKNVSELSGGQKQRIAIARALMNKPELLLADEPTGALDEENSGRIMQLFRKLNSQGQTVLVVTHDTKVAKECDRILTVIDGRVVDER